jgi:ElaA protein
MRLHWRCQRLTELEPLALYELLALRAQVFVVEQQCIYLDPDGVDLEAWHLLGLDADGRLLAYARLLAPLTKGEQQRLPMIGRVLNAPGARGRGQGRVLMQEAIAQCARLWPGQDIAINAQAYLQGFYASLGFAVVSEPYDEDGIAHVDMRRAS